MLVKILINFKTLSLASCLPARENTPVRQLIYKQEASDRVLNSIRISTTIGILKQLQKLLYSARLLLNFGSIAHGFT